MLRNNIYDLNYCHNHKAVKQQSSRRHAMSHIPPPAGTRHSWRHTPRKIKNRQIYRIVKKTQSKHSTWHCLVWQIRPCHSNQMMDMSTLRHGASSPEFGTIRIDMDAPRLSRTPPYPSFYQLINSQNQVKYFHEVSASQARLFQQAQYVDPMLIQCCASVVDGGPTLDQHRANVLYLLGC